MRTKLLVPALFTALFLLGCQSKNQNAQNPEAETPIVITVKAVERSFTPNLTFSGTVFANRESNLGATLPGKVEKIFFHEGANVQQGELIVELSDEILVQAEVENQAIRKDYERVKRLRDRGSISEMEYDHIKAKLDASDAKTEMTRKNTRVFAPFSGTIVERMMEEGEIYFINPGLDPGYSMRSGIVRLMQLDPVRIKFDVNEKDISSITKGLTANISLDAFPDKSFKAKVTSIKPMLSTLTRTATAEIVISNQNGDLKPGMFARISVELPRQTAVFVPLSCISRLPGTGEDFVYIVDSESVAKRIVVSRRYTQKDMVAVTGVGANQQVVTEGMTRIFDGQKVVVR